MKKLVLALGVVTLFGCETGKDDLQQYVMEVKARKVPIDTSVPEIAPFEHLAYTGSDKRSPFLSPKPEAADEKLTVDKECTVKPNPTRQKQLLEQHALSSLAMRGVMAEGPTTWALVQAPGGELHRVKEGHYLGLHHGKIVKVNNSSIDIKEVVADGDGCWVERETQLALAQQ